MIEAITMYTANCDGEGCKDTYELYDGCIALNEKSAVEEDIKESGDWVLTTSGKVYCPDCHETHWNEKEDRLEAFSKDTDNAGSQFLGAVE